MLPTPSGWRLNPAPTWPVPPEDFVPFEGWRPDRTWKRPPRGWKLWLPADATDAPVPRPAEPATNLTWSEPLGSPLAPDQRRRVRWELWVVLSVFPLPALTAAVLLLLRASVDGLHHSGVSEVLPGHPLASSIAGAFEYAASALPVVAVVAFVVSGTGLPFRALGLTRNAFWRDMLAAVGIVASGLAIVFASGLVVYGIYGDKGLPGSYDSELDHLSAWFLIQGLVMSLVTAVVEETVINAYLVTRLGQLGWTPRKALWLGMAVRTSYHAYYGLALIFTIPVGYVLARSFQRHRRLQRCIAAHFLYDAVLISFSILMG